MNPEEQKPSKKPKLDEDHHAKSDKVVAELITASVTLAKAQVSYQQFLTSDVAKSSAAVGVSDVAKLSASHPSPVSPMESALLSPSSAAESILHAADIAKSAAASTRMVADVAKSPAITTIVADVAKSPAITTTISKTEKPPVITLSDQTTAAISHLGSLLASINNPEKREEVLQTITQGIKEIANANTNNNSSVFSSKSEPSAQTAQSFFRGPGK